MKAIVLLSAVLCSCFFLYSCTERKVDAFKSVPGYNFNTPIRLSLPLELDEISGISYYEKDSSIVAINDETGWLYKIYPNRIHTTEKWRFAIDADYEDIVLLDSIFYVLKSNGNIIAFRFSSNDSIIEKEFAFPSGKAEFEALYADTGGLLRIICKDCDADKKKFLSTYTFNVHTGEYGDGFTIDAKAIAGMLSKKAIKFKPSAAALHPLTGKLYIISAVNSLLVITDNTGKPEQVYEIDKKLFKQPEGLAFTPWGTLIISNESAQIGLANLLIYKYQTGQ